MKAIYAFSGDPITFGHIDIVARAAATYDDVVVAIGENPKKSGNYLFSSDERLRMATQCLKRFPNVCCVTFSGLLAEYAFRHGFDVIVRGVRNGSDLEGELVLFAVNNSLHSTIDTTIFPTRPHLSHISSGVVKAIVGEGGDVSQYCPLLVKEALEQSILGRFTVGLAGGIAAGKSWLADRLVERLSERVPATSISLDTVGHYVLSDAAESMYRETRERIAARFGRHVMRSDTSIDRRELGQIVFSDASQLAELNDMMREPMLARLYDESRQIPSGVILIEGAILVEADWTNVVNNNVILVDAAVDVRQKRLCQRAGVDASEAALKISRQPSAEERQRLMEARIDEHGWGRLWHVDTGAAEVDLAPLVDALVALAPPGN